MTRKRNDEKGLTRRRAEPRAGERALVRDEFGFDDVDAGEVDPEWGDEHAHLNDFGLGDAVVFGLGERVSGHALPRPDPVDERERRRRLRERDAREGVAPRELPGRRRPAAPKPPSPWKVLGVRRGAPLHEVRSAYQKLVAALHPDHGGNAGELQRVTEAMDEVRAYYGGKL